MLCTVARAITWWYNHQLQEHASDVACARWMSKASLLSVPWHAHMKMHQTHVCRFRLQMPLVHMSAAGSVCGLQLPHVMPSALRLKSSSTCQSAPACGIAMLVLA